MEELTSLNELFENQLKNLYSAETQLINHLSIMEEEASNRNLANAFSDHLRATESHQKEIEKIGEDLGIELKQETSEAMKGLIKEIQSLISKDATENVRDTKLITEAQRVEHYQITTCGSAIQFAEALNHMSATDGLQQILKEKKKPTKR